MRHLIIAFSDQEVAQKIKALLISCGLPVKGVCSTGAQVLQMATLCDDGGVVVCPIRLMDMTAQEVMSLLSDHFDMLVLATPRQQSLIGGLGIFTLVQPSSATAIVESVRKLLATRQLRADDSLDLVRNYRPPGPKSGLEPGNSHGRSPEDQKLIEQAKYLLMNRKKISESEAHRYLQKKSMESGIRLVELAKRIITPA